VAKNISTSEDVLVVAEDASYKLICKTDGMKYVPDTMRYIYGKSSRPPLEDWFLTELRFFEARYPGYEIFTLGSSCVFGEKFVNYLTICEFMIDGQESFQNLIKALKESDQAIRRKFLPMWKWDIAARKDWSIVFMVGHMDFAYFLQHRKEFQGDAHNHYMKTFTTKETVITSRDYKVLHDGTILPFDDEALSKEDRFVYENFHRIQYETIKKPARRTSQSKK
jgi:hypothetical protein